MTIFPVIFSKYLIKDILTTYIHMEDQWFARNLALTYFFADRLGLLTSMNKKKGLI